MWPFKRKVKKGVLHLIPVDHFECEHVVTTFQYGSHPQRVYALCPFCKKVAILDWADPKGRFFNRVFYGVPMIWQAILAFVAIGFILWFVTTLATVRPH